MSKEQALLVLSTKKLTEEQKMQVLSAAGLIGTERQLTATQISERLAKELNSKADAQALLVSSGLVTQKELQTNATIRVTAAKLNEAIASGKLSVADAAVIAGALGVTGVNVAEAASIDLITAAMWRNIKAFGIWLVTTPAGMLASIGMACVALYKIQQKLNKSFDECAEELDDYNSKIKQSQSSIESLETELKNCEDRLKELEKLNDDGSISIIDQEEYERLLKTNEELDRNIKLETERARLQATKAVTTADQTMNSTVESKVVTEKKYKSQGEDVFGYKMVSPTEELSAAILEYQDLGIEIYELNKAYAAGEISEEQYTKRLSQLTKEQLALRNRAAEMAKVLSDCETAYLNLVNAGGVLSASQQKNYEDVVKVNEEYIDFLKFQEGFDKYDRLTSLFGRENVEKLSKEDLEIAYTIENVGNITFEQLQAEIEKKRKEAKEPFVFQFDPSTLSSAMESLSKIQSLYSDFRQNLTDDDDSTDFHLPIEDIESLRDALKDANDNLLVSEEEFKKFEMVLADQSSSYDKIEGAFNNLITSYVDSALKLGNYTDETKELIKTQLELKGITADSADAYVEYQTAMAKAKEAVASVDLTEMTAKEVAELIEEGKYAGLVADQIWVLYDAKLAEEALSIDSSEDCQQLLNLANTAYFTAEALRLVEELKKVYDGSGSSGYAAAAIKEQLAALAKGEDLTIKPKINFDPSKVKKSGSDKKDKDTTKEFDWIEQAIEKAEKEIQKLDDIVNSSYSTFMQKNDALANEIGKVTDEIALQQQAYEEYMRKADSIGLDESYKALVRDGAINIENVSDEKLQEKISDYQQWYEKAVAASDSMLELGEKAKDLHVKGYELTADRIEELLERKQITEKQYLEEMRKLYQAYYEGQAEYAEQAQEAEFNLIEKTKEFHVKEYELNADRVEEMLANESITEKKYIEEMKKLYLLYYEGQVDYAEQAHEAKLKLLEKEKSYLNSLANAAASLFDKEIEEIQNAADEQAKPYEDQVKGIEKKIKGYDKEIKANQKVIDSLNDKIKAHNKEIDILNDKKKPLQDELDMLEEKARKENLILNLQKAQYEQARLENQRTNLIYTEENGMVYDIDATAAREAKKSVDDARLEIQKQSIQDQINAVDDEIEKINELIDSINDDIEKYNDLIDGINDCIDAANEQVDGLNDIIAGIGENADTQVEALGKLKNKWQEVIDQQEEAKSALMLTGEFGADAIDKILSGDESLLAKWKNDYIATVAGIDMESSGSIGNMTSQLSTLYGVDLSPLREQFGGVRDSVSEATDAVGEMSKTISGNDDGNRQESPSLKSSILDETETALSSFGQHTDALNGEVIPAIHSATEEMNLFNEAAGAEVKKTVTIEYVTKGSDAVKGKAYAGGSPKGLPRDEKNALRSEYGQQELTVYPDGTTELTTSPTMGDLPKGTVIYDEEQTKKILKNKSGMKGKAYAGGAVSEGWFDADGHKYIPIRPGDMAWEMKKAFEPLLQKMIENPNYFAVNAMVEHGKQMEKVVNQLNTANIVTNNKQQQSIVNNNEFNITLPNVTNSTSAETLMRDLQSLATKKFQINW